MSYRTEHGLPVGYIVYKEHDGLSTFYVKHKRDLPKPNYPMPARYHVDLDPDGLDTLDILGNIIFHADNIFYLHDYDEVD